MLLLLTRLEKQAPTCSKAKLKEEIDHLKRVLLKHNCPVVFCHNDMLCKNIVYDETKGRSYKKLFYDARFKCTNYLLVQ